MQMDLLDNPKIKQIKPRYLLLALIPAVLLLIAFISCTTIDSGSVGIRFKKWSSDASQYGGVLGTCKGWVWYNPITQKIFEYPIYVQRKRAAGSAIVPRRGCNRLPLPFLYIKVWIIFAWGGKNALAQTNTSF